MNFDLESRVYDILSKKNNSKDKTDLLKAYRLYLSTFDDIIDRSVINIEKLDDAILLLSKNNCEFTKIYDLNFSNRFHNLISNKILIPKYLPVTEDFHLAFWVWKLHQKPLSEEGVIYYAPIRTDFLKDSKFPMVDIRISRMYDDYIPEIVKIGKNHYNVLNSFYTISDPEVFINSYSKISDVLDYCRVDTED